MLAGVLCQNRGFRTVASETALIVERQFILLTAEIVHKRIERNFAQSCQLTQHQYSEIGGNFRQLRPADSGKLRDLFRMGGQLCVAKEN